MNDPLDHLYQDPVGALVQDLCSRIFWPTVSGSYRPTCARSLYQDRGTICARSLYLCIRILLDHLYQDPIGPLAQDLVSGRFRTACVRNL